MTGLCLGIDPGVSTGFALADIETEKVLVSGRLHRGKIDFYQRIIGLMGLADIMGIEGQYIPSTKNEERKLKARGMIGVIEAKQEVVTLWRKEYPDKRYFEFQAREWMCASGIKVKTRDLTKPASLLMARNMTRFALTCHDESDAVLLALYTCRQYKTEKLKLRAREG